MRFTASVATLVFFDVALLTAVVPLLAVWHESMGLSKPASGVVVGAYSAAILLASLPVGHLADRVGPKRVTVVAALAFAVSLPLLALAQAPWHLVAVRFAQGLCGAVSWTAALAWLNRAVPAAQRGRVLGVVTAAGSAGALFGPVIGGPLVSTIGLRGALWVVAAAVLLAFAGAATAPGVAPGARRTRPWHAVVRAAGREPRLWIALVALTDVALVSGTVQVLGPLHLSAEGLSSAAIGWIFTCSAVLGTLLNVLAGRVADRLDRVRLVGFATLALTAASAVLLAWTSVAPYSAVVVTLGTLASVTYALAYPLSADGAEAAGIGHGVAMGALSAVWGVGALVSPILAGAVAHAAGDRSAYAVTAVAAAAAWLAVAVGSRRAAGSY